MPKGCVRMCSVNAASGLIRVLQAAYQRIISSCYDKLSHINRIREFKESWETWKDCRIRKVYFLAWKCHQKGAFKKVLVLLAIFEINLGE